MKNVPMHPRQHAFRVGHSCDLALAEVIDFVEGGLEDGQVTAGIFLDIRGAFDNLDTKAAESDLFQIVKI